MRKKKRTIIIEQHQQQDASFITRVCFCLCGFVFIAFVSTSALIYALGGFTKLGGRVRIRTLVGP
jgi:hypothetical protein